MNLIEDFSATLYSWGEVGIVERERLLKRIVYGVTLVLLLTGILGLAFDVRCVSAQGNSPFASFRTWTVDDDGSADFHVIQEAINAANNGDTVFVKKGTYYEHVNVNKSILILAEKRNSSIVDAGFTGTAINMTANGACVDDLAIRNAGQSALSVFGDNNRIIAVDIYFDMASGFPKPRFGVEVQSSGNIIEKSTVFNTQYAGIAITTGSSVEKNACNNTIDGNKIAFGSDGVVLWDGQVSASPSVYGNRIVGNTIYNNSDNSSGIHLHMTYGNTVAYNTVRNNYGGVWLEYSYSYHGFNGNAIHHNNFVNNTHNVVGTLQSYNNMWDDGSEGNYWSDYDGVDADEDGIGDSAYVFDVNNRDNYPLTLPLIEGDANHDGIVNIKDLSLLAVSWQSRQGESRYNPHVDFNLDEIVNIIDIGIIGINWQKHV